MSSQQHQDPFVVASFRIRKSIRDALLQEAEAASCSLSDCMRAHVELAAVKPLGTPKRRGKRPVRLDPPSGADPKLMRLLGSIDSHLARLGQMLVAGDLPGAPVQIVNIAVLLRGIEMRLERFASL